ncbi:MAG: hypothetical protein DLM61_15060 [Pseudonocardiales bacterium]|nr:MAG: hypothetical protein DLM61_15060 [Pseudonocardiales bacterium]
MPNESAADGAPEPASPFPPAFRWETSAQEAPTQVIGAVGRDTALREPSIDERSENSTPPWAELDPPPIAEQQSDWLRLGPEVFQSEVPESRSKRTLGIAVLAVVVLGLAGAAMVYFLTGGSSNRTGSGQVTAPQTTTAPRVQPVLPTVPAAAPPVTGVAPVTAPAAPVATPEATGSPEPPPMAPAAPPPAALPPSPPPHRSAGSGTQGRAAVPAPHTESRPTSEAPPAPPADTSAPEGFTRVPSKPWNPQPPQ